jgi:hypothetical protein
MVRIWPYQGVPNKNIFDHDYLKTLAHFSSSQFLIVLHACVYNEDTKIWQLSDKIMQVVGGRCWWRQFSYIGVCINRTQNYSSSSKKVLSDGLIDRSWKPAIRGHHPPAHHKRWMVIGQETDFCWVPVPSLPMRVTSVPFFTTYLLTTHKWVVIR